jgi:phospholipid/cholesterol/gamma-HCH transport system ATP-binding protein
VVTAVGMALALGDKILPTGAGVVLPIDQKRQTNGRSDPYLALRNVSQAFGSNQVLNDVSFAVMPGETVCILGRSGAGKSVCLRLFMGFLKPCSGRVIAAHEDITDYSEQELERIHKKVTMVFQNGALFDSLTAAENVAFPLRERGQLDEDQIYQIVDGLLEMVNAENLRDRYPGEISTGAKRLIAIARALAAEPEAILYDEPTTNVDPLMERRLGELIKKLKRQLSLTSVVVTHDMSLAERIADHVVFLEGGKVIFYGTKEEMNRSSVPLVQQFRQLDLIDLNSILRMSGTQRLAG